MKCVSIIKKVLIMCFVLMFNGLNSQVRQDILLEENWKFSREDNPNFTNIEFDDSKWQNVTVPHDWAIYGPFDSKNDIHHMAIVQDGQTSSMAHTGRTGGLPFVGVGWYRTEFEVPNFTEGKKVSILFDGAMSRPTVYINGKKAGHWGYGYNSFHLDITPFLNKSGKNTLAVRLENLPESSRWYPGAGLYRNVHLIVTNDLHIPIWGTQVTTDIINKDYAEVNFKVKLNGVTKGKKYKIETTIESLKNGSVVTSSSYSGNNLFPKGYAEIAVGLSNPELWSPENPHLYTAVTKIYEDDILKDEYSTKFGVREIEVIPNKGFYLNGERIIFKGVCLHHDLGPLGGIVNEAGIRRQIRILQDMGCNAIRTSHNMPAPELIRICDEMGMMVMAESFDEWALPKVKNGYNLLFKEWAERDLVNLVHQFRNNPSIVMWCIGNEVPEQHAEGGVKVARFLQDICHREDPTRPVTQGMDNPQYVIGNNFAAVMDVAGFNYRPWSYPLAYKKLPQELVLGSETSSTISSRGVYKFPVERRSMHKYDDNQCSSYDVEHCGWSNLPEDDFIQHEDYSWCMGEFVWTGFDYLGEPTPYYTDWPSHSSMFGIIDLAGIPKDRYYLYRSHWNKEVETLHILPHWNWKGREGEVTPVFVYTNYPSAELFINGKSQGRRTKDLSIKVQDSDSEEDRKNFTRQKRYRLMWMDTKYEPGTVKVVAYDENGKAVAEKEIHTAGEPYRIELSADRTNLDANGKDLSYITVKVVDKDGNLCPNADNLINFKVKGAGTYRAAANGDPTSLDLFHKPEMPLFSGMLTAIIQTSKEPGEITLEAKAKGLKSAKITVHSVKTSN